MKDDTVKLYIDTLAVLGDTLVTMSSPLWSIKAKKLTPSELLAADETRTATQNARLKLANTALAAIVDEMQVNEDALQAGITGLQAKLDKFEKIESVLNATAGVLSIVGKIIKLV